MTKENSNNIPEEGYFKIPLSQYISRYTNKLDIRKTNGTSFISSKGVNMSGTKNTHLDLLQLFQLVMINKEPKSRKDIIFLVDFGFDVALCKEEITRT